MTLIKCSDCGIEGIHACLGKPVNKDNLPDGIVLFDSGELVRRMQEELDKYGIDKLSL